MAWLWHINGKPMKNTRTFALLKHNVERRNPPPKPMLKKKPQAVDLETDQ
ncbi:MAG: hypothetical protein KME50_00970 [Nostoc desertorum CM1-VF14]|jgi:hypothetical protein|nr:hypothetical protein [Nostoc desertorum CM1-VF14]